MKNSEPFIPFVRANTDLDYLADYYSDAPICRVSLDRKKNAVKLGAHHSLWIDIGFDGVPAAFGGTCTPEWRTYVNHHGDLSALANEAFIESPIRSVLEPVLIRFLDEANSLNPYFISVPQLPHANDVRMNKINRLLATIASGWKNQRKTPARLILPVIFTNQRQLNKKTERNPKLKFIESLVAREGFDAVWATDASLEDQSGTGNFDKERFPGIIDFFKELRAGCDLSMIVTGPFWGLGLLLWARGLVTHFGIGLGSTYRYYSPGGISQHAKARVAVSPLRRWASSTPDLQTWLKNAQTILPHGSTEQRELRDLEKQFPALLSQELSKRQVARVYREWLNRISQTPQAGRAVALYQDLSAAFVTGKSLPDFSDEVGPARRPERVAEQLMVNCL